MTTPRKIHHFDTIGSTNDLARSLIASGCENVEVVIANTQISGKGRNGKEWVSPYGGLWFSIILFPYNLEVSHTPLFSLTIALAISKGIEKKTGLFPLIKFPNDLYVNNKKLCGILIETNVSLNRVNWIIVGIGINVNIDIDILPDYATSIKNELKKGVDQEMLFSSVLEEIEKVYLAINRLDDFLLEIKERGINIPSNFENVSCN